MPVPDGPIHRTSVRRMGMLIGGFIQMQKRVSRLTWLAAAVVGLGTGSLALANSGTQLPLDQYQAGSETTSSALVTNGDFEQPGAPNPNPSPTGWTQVGTVQAGTPINPPNPVATVGSFAAQGPLGNNVDGNKYTQSVALAPATDYVISAYLWNFGVGIGDGNGDLTVAELVDDTNAFNTVTLALERVASDNGDGANGYFVYSSFNSSQFPAGVTLEVEGDFDGAVAGTRPNIWFQVDNVAITQASAFAPPVLIPEPGALMGLACAGLLALRRR